MSLSLADVNSNAYYLAIPIDQRPLETERAKIAKFFEEENDTTVKLLFENDQIEPNLRHLPTRNSVTPRMSRFKIKVNQCESTPKGKKTNYIAGE